MNNPINLRGSLALAWLPIIGLIPIVLTIVVALAFFRDGDDPARWQVPALAMGVLGIGIMLIMGIGVALRVAFEYASIRRVVASPWARWRPYPTAEEWQAAVEEDRRKALQNAKFSIAPIIVLGVFLVFILFMLNVVILPQRAAEIEPDLGLRVSIVLVALFGIGAAAVIGGGIYRRIRTEGRYRGLRAMSLPEVVVGRGGAYHEAEGFTSFWGPRDCAASGSRVTFSIYHYGYGGNGHISWTEKLSIPVPAESRDEVRALVERINKQILRRG